MSELSEEPRPTAPPSKKPVRSELIVAIAAIVISIATLFVYMYQEHIMQSQQHVSTWPYLNGDLQ